LLQVIVVLRCLHVGHELEVLDFNVVCGGRDREDWPSALLAVTNRQVCVIRKGSKAHLEAVVSQEEWGPAAVAQTHSAELWEVAGRGDFEVTCMHL
jgi:hypothetical protein